MTYEVVVSEPVKTLLEGLHESDRRRSRELALLLLRLEKDARPDGSRRLAAETKSRSGNEERVWETAGFRIAYRIVDARRVVEVGIVAEV